MIIFDWENPQIEDGFYLVETKTEVTVAHWEQGIWNIIGIEYDRWSIYKDELKIIAKLDFDKLTIKRME